MPPQQNDETTAAASAATAEDVAPAPTDATVVSPTTTVKDDNTTTTTAAAAVKAEDDTAADPSSSSSPDDLVRSSIANAVNTDSYWDAPPDSGLNGKTLSTMDMTMLESQKNAATDDNNNNESSSPSDNINMVRRPSTHSYWDWQEGLKKTLSNMSLSNLRRGSHEEHNNQQQQENGNSGGDNGSETAAGPGGYWSWKNPSLRNLSSAVSLRSLERAVKESEENKKSTTSTTEGATTSIPRNDSVNSTGSTGSGYWFWRNPSMSKLSFSNANLDDLDKSSKDAELDKSNGSTRSIGSNGSGGGPITNLQHRLRNSWRASFKQLSSNSLRGLDELGNSGSGAAASKQGYTEARKKSLSERNSSSLGFGNGITCEESEHDDDDDDSSSIGSGALTF